MPHWRRNDFIHADTRWQLMSCYLPEPLVETWREAAKKTGIPRYAFFMLGLADLLHYKDEGIEAYRQHADRYRDLSRMTSSRYGEQVSDLRPHPRTRRKIFMAEMHEGVFWMKTAVEVPNGLKEELTRSCYELGIPQRLICAIGLADGLKKWADRDYGDWYAEARVAAGMSDPRWEQVGENLETE